MPSFTATDIRHLDQLVGKRKQHVYIDDAKRLIDLAVVFPVNYLEHLVEVEVSEYGHRVLRFYNAIKAGEVKAKSSQCSGCTNPC